MTFLNTWAWFLLAGLPLLILLYFLKLKRPSVVVASTLLWQKVIEDMRVNSPFQKLRSSLLLLLQILLLLAIVAALLRPLIHAPDRTESSLILCLDTSASMLAKTESGDSRFETATDMIRKMMEAMGKNDQMTLISFNTRSKLECGFSGNRRYLKTILDTIEPSSGTTDIEPALILARSVASARRSPRCIVFSDGAFTGTSNLDLPMEVEYRQIGENAPNLAVTGLDIRRSLHNRDNIEMFVALDNLSEIALEGTMTVELDGQVLDSKRVSTAAGETLSQIFEAELPMGGAIRVSLDVEDALDVDNHAWKMIAPPLHRRVMVVGTRNFFLNRLLNASPGTQCTEVAPADYSEDNAVGYHTVIWNTVETPGIAPANNLYLGCAPDLEGLSLAGDIIPGPEVTDWKNTHPLNRFLDFRNLIISEAPPLTLPDGAEPILNTVQSPLIGSFVHKGRGMCVVSFDPMKSNWPLVVSFPIFLNNCLDYFTEIRARQNRTNIRVGNPIVISRSYEDVSIITPSGETHELTAHGSGDYSFSEVNECGVYRVRRKDEEELRIAVNLFDVTESTLTVIETPMINGDLVAASSAAATLPKEYWKWILLGGAILLVLEWTVYHRRVFT